VAEKLVAFSYNHYQSPKFVSPLLHATYKSYYETGLVDTTPPAAPSGVSVAKLGTAIVPSVWSNVADALYYSVYRNGSLVGRASSASFQDKNLSSGTFHSCSIRAVDAAGNISDPSATIGATTAATGVNLSQARPYSASVPADSHYSDDSGTELTDGAYGTPVYHHLSWQGRLASSYSFTIDLGALQRVDQVQADFLHDSVTSIALPEQVSFSLSADSLIYTVPAVVVRQRPTPPSGTSVRYSHLWLSMVARYVKVTVVTTPR